MELMYHRVQTGQELMYHRVQTGQELMYRRVQTGQELMYRRVQPAQTGRDCWLQQRESHQTGSPVLVK